jgi:hypothetical protein
VKKKLRISAINFLWGRHWPLYRLQHVAVLQWSERELRNRATIFSPLGRGGLATNTLTSRRALWWKHIEILRCSLSQVPQLKCTQWRSWLRHCATNRNVAGSIPDGVTGIFHWHNRFGRTMALGSTQPLTEISTRNLSWGIKAAGA